MKLKDFLTEEVTKVISVARMSDANKGDLKKKVKGMDKADDEYQEIVSAFGKDVLKHNGYIRDKKSIEKALKVDHILGALEPGGEGFIELPSVNEYDVVMIAGESFMKIGRSSDFIFAPITKR
jgi:N-methylhydantoinase B/oxoprolinase/acetone carboxylase alpha subunit